MDWALEFNSDDPEAIKWRESLRAQFEGTSYWDETEPEFLEIGGCPVLLPVNESHHPHIEVLHHFFREDKTRLVVYLKDLTFDENTWNPWSMAVCRLFQNENFYVATFYHEWFPTDNEF